jgi:ubiquinone/menaquinone biosynthesis C-methylase UbiE
MKKNNIEKLFWNHYAKSYDNLAKHFKPYENLMQEVCQHIDDFAEGKPINILDAGCGTGNYVLELCKRGHKVVGIDSSETMLALANDKVKTQMISQPPKILSLDMTDPLPFESGRFDAVMSIHVLYTLDDHQRFIGELRRVAHRSSIIVIVNSSTHLSLRDAVRQQIQMTNKVKRLRSLIALLSVGFWNTLIAIKEYGKYRITTEEELKHLLINAGASEVKVCNTYVGSTLAIGYWR